MVNFLRDGLKVHWSYQGNSARLRLVQYLFRVVLDIQVVVLEWRISGEKWGTFISWSKRLIKSIKVNFPRSLRWIWWEGISYIFQWRAWLAENLWGLHPKTPLFPRTFRIVCSLHFTFACVNAKQDMPFLIGSFLYGATTDVCKNVRHRFSKECTLRLAESGVGKSY